MLEDIKLEGRRVKNKANESTPLLPVVGGDFHQSHEESIDYPKRSWLKIAFALLGILIFSAAAFLPPFNLFTVPSAVAIGYGLTAVTTFMMIASMFMYTVGGLVWLASGSDKRNFGTGYLVAAGALILLGLALTFTRSSA